MKQRNGIWMSDFYLPNGERIRKSLKTTDKAHAKRLERELQVSMEKALKEAPAKTVAGLSSGPHGMTFRTAFRRAMKEHEPWRTSTAQKTITDNYAHVTGYFKEDRDLASITRQDMLRYVEKLRDELELSPSTINQRLSLVSVLMKYAEEWTEGAVQVIKMPRQKTRTGRIRILSFEEEFTVIRWFLHGSKRKRGKDEDMADLVKFLVDTGFRLSEALRLHSSEVDWDNGMVPAWETKADLPRQVPMTKRVRAILENREHLERPFEMFSVDSADDHWEIMRKGLKVDPEKDPEFVLHALRHTCASRLAASGMDAFKIQKWMGHKDIKTTQKYVTLFGSDLHDLADALDKKRTEAAKKVPIGGRPGVSRIRPKGVPITVPKWRQSGSSGNSVGSAEGLVLQRSQTVIIADDTVGDGLLIRRSLVRAQVGEPKAEGSSIGVDTNTPTACDQECDQN